MAEEPGDDQPGAERRRTTVMSRAVDESGIEQLLNQAVTHRLALELAAFDPVLEVRR
jgi:hypothetical protein